VNPKVTLHLAVKRTSYTYLDRYESNWKREPQENSLNYTQFAD